MFEVMTKGQSDWKTHLIQPMTVIWSNRPLFIFVKLNFISFSLIFHILITNYILITSLFMYNHTCYLSCISIKCSINDIMQHPNLLKYKVIF